MGEYAVHKGERIKIGTCENLYYLRADQATQVVAMESDDTNVLQHLDAFRFRFPFPDEDSIKPGEFRNPDRAIPLHGVSAPPEGVEHGTVQFKSNYPREGYLLSLPCPEGPDAVDGIKVHKNGWGGDVRIVQQRVWGNLLVLVAECGGCGNRWRYEKFEDVAPVIVACLAEADNAALLASRLASPARIAELEEGSTAQWWRTVADRIIAGYANPPAWVAAR